MTNQPTCIIIMGPYRSGTSLVARVLSYLGVYLGPDEELYEPSPYNPAGYFQRPDITRINTAFIQSANANLERPPSPIKLAGTGDLSLLQAADLAWNHEAPLWGMKDPRFCVTLHSWFQAGVLKETGTRIVRVARSLDTAARSAIQHYDVKRLCGMDIDRAGAMLALYDSFADWHVKQPNVSSIGIGYEDLVEQPTNTIRSLADYLGATDPEKIEQAIATVGTGRSIVET